jgi:hypothetical protein
MTAENLQRRTICVLVDSPDEVQAVDAWLAKWRDKLTYLSPNEGCGCCVDIYRVEGPAEAITEIPSGLISDGWPVENQSQAIQ